LVSSVDQVAHLDIEFVDATSQCRGHRRLGPERLRSLQDGCICKPKDAMVIKRNDVC
jgi:hypothetical protein